MELYRKEMFEKFGQEKSKIILTFYDKKIYVI